MAGDHAVMAAFVRTAGVILVDGFDALFDVVSLSTARRAHPCGGLGVVTNSGAVRGVALDLAADLGVALPEPAPATRAALHAVLPEFAQPDNPLDITAQGMARPALFGETAAALLADPGIDALLVAAMGGGPAQVLDKWRALRPVLAGSGRPVMLVFLGDGHPMPDALMREVAAARVPFLRSLETGHARAGPSGPARGARPLRRPMARPPIRARGPSIGARRCCARRACRCPRAGLPATWPRHGGSPRASAGRWR
ncbi:MAG: hypothetical protein KatS3mg118_3175 [Paracoccaceae bacterium]|nr:MAG: hypothetical protein KatS3mg118_3175 [Paracoccaceae bacterium]